MSCATCFPRPRKKEIRAFDRAREFEPGNYTLLVPKGANTLGAARSRSEKRPGRHEPGNGKITRKVVRRSNDVRRAFQP